MKRTLTIFCALLLLSACDREHEATPTVRAFLEALQYGDVDGVFERHLDSTRRTPWCADEFQTALQKAQGGSGEDCERLREMTSSDLDALNDEMRLAVQIAGWACENRDGTCVDYSEAVFRQAVDEHPLVTSRPTGYTIRRVFGDDAHAVAYVDLRQRQETEHRTLELRKVGNDWHVVKGFLDR